MNGMTREDEIINGIEDTKEMTDEELKEKYRTYHSIVERDTGTSVTDLRIYTALTNELKDRGIRITTEVRFHDREATE